VIAFSQPEFYHPYGVFRAAEGGPEI